MNSAELEVVISFLSLLIATVISLVILYWYFYLLTSVYIRCAKKEFNCCPICKSKKIKTKPISRSGQIIAASVCCKNCGANISKEWSLYKDPCSPCIKDPIQQLKDSWNNPLAKFILEDERRKSMFEKNEGDLKGRF